MDKHDVLPIGEIVERSGFAASALRFYESEGLIAASQLRRRAAPVRAQRAPSARLHPGRVERRPDPRRDQGRALAPARATARPPRPTGTGSPSTGAARLDEQIAALERLKTGLESCIGCGCLSLQRCAFSNPGDWVASSDSGPGARTPARLAPQAAPDPPLTRPTSTPGVDTVTMDRASHRSPSPVARACSRSWSLSAPMP